MAKKKTSRLDSKVPISDSVFRSGDQAEYLAQYLLSNFGASVLIPRQEDHGFDFLCSLNSAKPNELPDFRDSFYLQVKVGDPNDVSIGGFTNGKTWRSGRLRWFFNLDIPFLLGFVHLGRKEIKIYQTSARWLVYYYTINRAMPCEVVLSPELPVADPAKSKRKKSKVKPNASHDATRWRIPLGPPLVTIKLKDVSSESAKKSLKVIVSAYVDLERTNSAHRIFKTQWGAWVNKMGAGTTPFGKAWVAEEKKFPKLDNSFYQEFGIALASIIFRLRGPRNRPALREASSLFLRLEKRWNMSPSMLDVVKPFLLQ